MIVKQILVMKSANAKPGVDANAIATVKPDAVVREAVALLSELRIGAVVVSSDGSKPAGILSERDIVRELGKQGAEVLDRPISDLMTKEVSTCTAGEEALAILDRMTKGRFRHLPVVDENGAMIGLVSIGDAVSARLKELAAEKEALTGMIMGS